MSIYSTRTVYFLTVLQSVPFAHHIFSKDHSPLDFNFDFQEELPGVYGHKTDIRQTHKEYNRRPAGTKQCQAFLPPLFRAAIFIPQTCTECLQ